jgi:uncharacterized phosphosugar-binding protein
MDGLSTYYEHIVAAITRIDREERANIERAARLMADQIKAGKVIHCYGPGVHSYMGCEEMFYRKGGLIPVNPLLATGLSASVGARLATLTEGQPEYSNAVLAYYGLKEGDLLVIFNAYGFNACAVQGALRAKELGVTVIALTSPAHANQVPLDQPNRHPSKRLLHEIADVILDIKMAPGDAVVTIDNCPDKAGAAATILHAYVINCLAIRTAELLAAEGLVPPIDCPSRPDLYDEFIARFGSQIRHY